MIARTMLLVFVLAFIAIVIGVWLQSRPPKAARLKSEEKNELLSLRQFKDNVQLGVGESGEEHAGAIVLDELREHQKRMRELNS